MFRLKKGQFRSQISTKDHFRSQRSTKGHFGLGHCQKAISTGKCWFQLKFNIDSDRFELTSARSDQNHVQTNKSISISSHNLPSGPRTSQPSSPSSHTSAILNLIFKHNHRMKYVMKSTEMTETWKCTSWAFIVSLCFAFSILKRFFFQETFWKLTRKWICEVEFIVKAHQRTIKAWKKLQFDNEEAFKGWKALKFC